MLLVVGAKEKASITILFIFSNTLNRLRIAVGSHNIFSAGSFMENMTVPKKTLPREKVEKSLQTFIFQSNANKRLL
jgi:hypothetical protein